MDLYAGRDLFTFSYQLDILFQLSSTPLPYVAIAEVLQTHAPLVVTPTLGTEAVSIRSRRLGRVIQPIRQHQGNLLAFCLHEARSVGIFSSCREPIY